MTVQIETNVLETRMNLYQLLSHLYKEPTKDTLLNLDVLEMIIKDYDEVMLQIVLDMKENIKRHVKNEDLNIESLLIDYAQLFIGPLGVAAPPYGSVYLEDSRAVMGRSTTVVENYYRKAGLQMTDRTKPADHISFQLEYVYYLNYQVTQGNNDNYIQLQAEFFDQILTKWIPAFTSAIKEGATTDFYRNLALLTEIFIEKEAVIVRQL